MKLFKEVFIFSLLLVLPLAMAVHMGFKSQRTSKGIECYINKNCVQWGYFNFGSK